MNNEKSLRSYNMIILPQIVLRILARVVCILPSGSPCVCQKCVTSHPDDIICSRASYINTASNASNQVSAPMHVRDLNGFSNELDRHGNNQHVHELSESQYAATHAQLDDVRRSLHDLLLNLRQKDKELARIKLAAMEWKEVGRVLDRTFTWVYLVIIIVSLLTLFPRPPNMKFFWETASVPDEV